MRKAIAPAAYLGLLPAFAFAAGGGPAPTGPALQK